MTTPVSKVIQETEGCKCVSRQERLVAAVALFGELMEDADHLSALVGAIPASPQKVAAKLAAMDLHEVISSLFWKAARELATLEGRPTLFPIQTRVGQVCEDCNGTGEIVRSNPSQSEPPLGKVEACLTCGGGQA